MTEPVPRSLHEHDFKHLEAMIASLDRLIHEKFEGIEGKIEGIDQRHTELAAARDKAVDIALQAAKEKAQAHNELLDAMKHQQSSFCTKEQAEIQNTALAARINAVEKYQLTDQTKDKTTGMNASLVLNLLIAASVIISIVVYFANR